jgi:hypothetical protein
MRLRWAGRADYFSARSLNYPDATLIVEDIHAYERTHGEIPSGAIVVGRSGWGRFWPDKKHYLGSDKPGDVANLHFPGFSPEAVKFLLTDRNVMELVIDTPSLDPGNSKDFPVHRMWLGANRIGLENLANADKLPFSGATIFCIPMKIDKGTGRHASSGARRISLAESAIQITVDPPYRCAIRARSDDSRESVPWGARAVASSQLRFAPASGREEKGKMLTVRQRHEKLLSINRRVGGDCGAMKQYQQAEQATETG